MRTRRELFVAISADTGKLESRTSSSLEERLFESSLETEPSESLPSMSNSGFSVSPALALACAPLLNETVSGLLSSFTPIAASTCASKFLRTAFAFSTAEASALAIPPSPPDLAQGDTQAIEKCG